MELALELKKHKPYIVPLITGAYELKYFNRVGDKWKASSFDYAFMEDAERNKEYQEVILVLDQVQRFVNLHENIKERFGLNYGFGYMESMARLQNGLKYYQNNFPSKKTFAGHINNVIADCVHTCTPKREGNNKKNGLQLVEFLENWSKEILQNATNPLRSVSS